MIIKIYFKALIPKKAEIKLEQFAAARMHICESLALALRLGALPLVVINRVIYFAELAHAEGQTEWALDPSVVEAGMKKGAELDWDETVKELLK